MAKSPLIVGCAVSATVALAHIGLIGRGRWQGDEYFNFVFFRDIGNLFFTTRLLQWSPRPWSEMLLYLYGETVMRFRLPLITACLGLLWGGLALACVVPALAGGGGTRRLARLFVGVSLFSLFLVGQDISEMFFWPAAALAYVTTLAAVTLLFWCLADGLGGSRSVAAAFALAAAAGCTEVGASFVAVFCGVVLVGRVRRLTWALWWLVPGLAVAVAVLWLIVHGQRFGTVPPGENAYYHRLLPSLTAGIWPMVLDLAGGRDARDVGTALAIRLMLVVGVRWCWPSDGLTQSGRALLPVYGFCLLVAAYGSVAAAYYQLGDLCCQRHETLRQCFLLLALAALAVWSVEHWPARRVAVMPLALAVMLPFVLRAPALVAEYGHAAMAARALKQTWRSGLAQGTDTMVLVQDPVGRLIHNTPFVAGTYSLSKDTEWSEFGVLKFFGKQVVTILPPG